MVVEDLLSSFSVAMLAIAVWGHFPIKLDDRPRTRCLAMGVVMGCGVVGTMLMPVQIQPGVFFDLRTPILAAAAFVGGPLSAIVAESMGLIYRWHCGGIGVWSGSAGIALAALIGAAGHEILGRRRPRFLHLLAMACSVSVATHLTIFLLPHAVWGAIMPKMALIAPLNLSCTLLFGLSLLRDEGHRRLIRTNGIYRAIIEALPDSINAKNKMSRFVAANPATATLMRANSASDLIGRSDADFYTPTMAEAFRQEELQVLSNIVVGPIDQEVEFPDGSRRWLTSLKTPLLNRRGEVQGVITHNRDITERKKLEIELLTAQTHLKEALANMADGLVLYDADCTIRFCNRQYQALFPVTADLRVPGAGFIEIIRASVARGEEAPTGELEAWLAERVTALQRPGDRTIELRDGRFIETRTRRIAESDTLVIFSDVTARKQIEQDLLRRASHDPLTGLPNRAEFDFQLRSAHQRARSEGTEVAVMMLDLDGFKQVNDAYGHLAGDKLLIEVAGRLQAAVRAGDVVARLGGDEFAFVLSGPLAVIGASSLAERILANLRDPFHTDGIVLFPRGSLGIAGFPIDAAEPLDLLRKADQALYLAKARGGGTWMTAALVDQAGRAA